MAMSRGRIDFYKEHYPVGTRVQLDSMGDDPRPVPAGTKGTVVAVDDIGTVHVHFDNGCNAVYKIQKKFLSRIFLKSLINPY